MEFDGARVDGAGAEGREVEDLKDPKVFEKNGGRCEDSRNGKRRYWIDNGEPAGSARIAR